MTDVKPDPFAAVAAQQAVAMATESVPEQRNFSTTAEDPFFSAHDLDDPFATSDDFRGGPFTPSPPIESLRGRLLAMFPRKFEAAVDDPFNKGKQRELYTVDLYVLNGGELKFPYRVKANPEKGEPERYEEFDAGTPSAVTPFAVQRFWVPQGALIGKLKATHRKGVPYLGVLDLGAQADDRKGGKTDAQIRAEHDAWIKRNKVGNGPRYSWVMDSPTPDVRKIATDFWAAHKADIAPINVATAPAESR